jgi:glycosyltransferase involved in cell wall biosynthesis
MNKLTKKVDMIKPAKHVTFAYVGPLQSRGRLLKQIATLQSVGISCDVVLGNTLPEEPKPTDYQFPITSIAVGQNSGKLASFSNQLRFCRAAAKIIAGGNADTVVCVALESLMAGVWAKRIRPSLRLVFDNNELHIECYGGGLKSFVWKPIHNYGVARSDVILHAERNRMEYFKKHYPGRDKPQLVIENFPFHGGEPTARPLPSDEVRVVYLGGFGDDRFTEDIILSFAKLPPSMKLDIIGFGRPEYLEHLRNITNNLGVAHVRLLPPVPYLKIPELLADYHIGVALYRNTDLNNYYCAPNKVYDYLMNGMPVITNRYPGLVSVIDANRVGVCIDEVSAPEIREAIELICRERRWENITTEIRRRYCWERQVSDYLEVFGIS